MNVLALLGYVVAASCIVTYLYAASGRSLTPNLWANMLGGPVVAFGNALVGYWPAVILEVFFTFAGLYGLCRLWYKRRHAWDLRILDQWKGKCPNFPHTHNGIGQCGTDPATW